MKSQIRSRPQTREDHYLRKMMLGGIGSFLLVLVFPRGARYFFRHWFAEIARDIVVIALAGLITQKIADILSRHARPTKRPSI